MPRYCNLYRTAWVLIPNFSEISRRLAPLRYILHISVICWSVKGIGPFIALSPQTVLASRLHTVFLAAVIIEVEQLTIGFAHGAPLDRESPDDHPLALF